MLKNFFYSVLWNKCPACHCGRVFKFPNAYNLTTFDKMHDTCPCCNELYFKEPGFYYGAMYVSYALMVGWFLITWGINAWLINAGVWAYLGMVSLSIILFTPLTFRISRLVWLNFFVRYDAAKNECLPKH